MKLMPMSQILDKYDGAEYGAELLLKHAIEHLRKIEEAAKQNWNSQADQCNQWSELGDDEKQELIAKEKPTP